MIWFFGFAGYLWVDSNNRNANVYAATVHMCDSTLHNDNQSLQHLETEDERARGESANVDKNARCRDDAEKVFHQSANDILKRIPIMLAISFATVVVGWLVFWFELVILRRIWRGFA
jgi:hypothetical protein